jgi:hypothetical protein
LFEKATWGVHGGDPEQRLGSYDEFISKHGGIQQNPTPEHNATAFIIA